MRLPIFSARLRSFPILSALGGATVLADRTDSTTAQAAVNRESIHNLLADGEGFLRGR
jgi:hypothetical protein